MAGRWHTKATDRCLCSGRFGQESDQTTRPFSSAHVHGQSRQVAVLELLQSGHQAEGESRCLYSC
ncbi:hypothetical protein GQ607_004791 [Colletotrichum asianum]|uniref:Uncharacterized protein n=1 Tax=Colletotrichum asianum TaxID=702518 RepID=A0A8H3WKN0_9PEZI|nr:hypothetical protein GQ607_004791 [Colletotrichum asianum]